MFQVVLTWRRQTLMMMGGLTSLRAVIWIRQVGIMIQVFCFSGEVLKVSNSGMPSGFPDDQAAPLLCAGIIGYRSLRLCEIQPGGRLGLYGFGASAHVTIQVARHWDCDVYVFTRSEEHRRHALELGATWVGQAQDTPPAKIDSAITFAPAGWLVPEALRVLRKGGTLAINAIHMSPIPELPYALLYGERTVRSVANATRQDAVELLQLAAEIPIHTDVELYALSDANAVLQRLKRAEIQGAAVLQIP